MEWINTFRNSEIALNLADHLHSITDRPMRLMEVCGTHTVAISRYGIRKLLPPEITLTSGPGCPVCVTSSATIDTFIEAGKIANSIITTFGDLIRVPGSTSSLAEIRGQGADIRVVYSVLDALEIARNNPTKEIIFLGVGFETTTPTIAAAILQAEAEKISNFSVISAHKMVPPALTALATDPNIRLDGLLCPGHVSIIIGASAYVPLAEQFLIPCVVAGFEPVDILHGITLLVKQVNSKSPAKVEISYQRAVSARGNIRALEMMAEVFEVCSTHWRGIGTIDQSGLRLRPGFQQFDAEKKFSLAVPSEIKPNGCRCGDILKGLLDPQQCPMFHSSCTPGHPVGPCMVSSEGACAASYRYLR